MDMSQTNPTPDAARLKPGPWRIAGLALVFVWFFFGGVGHFALTKVFVSVVPPYVPYPREMVWFTGACEIAGAAGIFVPRLRPLAGICLVLLTICVTPANLDMALHADRYPSIGAPLLWIRLLFQPVFIWIVWASTRPPR